ncbi:MAG: M20/M25/M40 family metallo-hydrolase [Candidatus Hydrogenedentes bacterium]|nr:M20/M25/M40 family metallo-hydrolase [Candidatus Hydrogenedentota bacterium]
MQVTRDMLAFALGKRWASWGVLVFLTGWTVFQVHAFRAPDPLGDTAPPDQFSAARAMRHVEEIAREPHPIGTPENARVRAYLEQELAGLAAKAPELGVELETDRAYVERDVRRPPYLVCLVENVLARIPGTAPGKAVLLMAHYDSTPYGPGAADDASGVAAMLETARALVADAQAGRRLENDVILLFTDGEEAGVLGAQAFRKHRWYNDVGLVLNFEARGYYGPSFMFETSPRNGWLIRGFAKAAPYPVASSFMYDIAGRMPTSTDYRILKQDGVPGLNFAFIGGIKYYHTENDDAEHIDRGSVQHHGSYALALTRYFGREDLTRIASEDYTYFNVLGFHLALYPSSWTWPLCAGVTALFLMVAGWGLCRGVFTWRGAAWGVLALPLCLVLTMLPVAAMVAAGWAFQREYIVYNSGWYLGAALAFTLGLFSVLYAGLRRRVLTQDLHLGALFWWCALAVLLAALLPGGAYLATWPAAASLLMLGGGALLARRGRPGAAVLWMATCALPIISMLVPTIVGFHYAVTVIPAPFWMAFVVLTAALLSPLVALAGAVGARLLHRAVFGAAALLFLWALLSLRFTPDHPKMNSLCYGLNFDRHQAVWMSSDDDLDEWTSQFFPSGLPRASVRDFRPDIAESYLRAPAPLAMVPEPEIRLVEERMDGGMRRLRLHIRSGRAAPRIRIEAGPQTEVCAAWLNGIQLGPDGYDPQARPGQPWWVQYEGRSEAGLDLEVRVSRRSPVEFTLFEESFGVPAIPQVSYTPRPAHMVTEPNTIEWWRRFRSNVTYTVKTWRMEETPPA